MNFDKRLSFFLVLSFAACTIVGTLAHEFGHYLMLKLVGLDGVIRYQSTQLLIPKGQILTAKKDYLTTLGGPLQTMLTGTIGFILLALNYKKIKLSNNLSLLQWSFIFLTLFWLRQLANLFVLVMEYFLKGKFSRSGDEYILNAYLKLPFLSINITTAIIGSIILSIVFFKFIPKNKRMTFIISGLIGGILGFILWMYILGPILLP